MAGKIIADDLQHSTAGSVGTEYVVNGSAKNWVNCSNGGVVNDSFNTSSVTDSATGKYDVNLSNAMSNANYHYSCANVKSGDNSPCAGFNGSLTTTVYRLETTNFSSYIDPDRSTGQVQGDLA